MRMYRVAHFFGVVLGVFATNPVSGLPQDPNQLPADYVPQRELCEWRTVQRHQDRLSQLPTSG